MEKSYNNDSVNKYLDNNLDKVAKLLSNDNVPKDTKDELRHVALDRRKGVIKRLWKKYK